MRRILFLAALALTASALTAPTLSTSALANDFYTPSPVPSSRDNIKPATNAKKAPLSWNNLKTSNKIVRTTKPAGSTHPQTAPNANPAQ